MIKFANPEYWYFFFLMPAAIGFVLFYYWKRRIILSEFCEESMLQRLLVGYNKRRKIFKDVLLIAGMFFLIIALIGPETGTKLRLVKRRGVDIVICFDTSLSMSAEDVSPNRLIRAKYEVDKFIDNLKGDRVGLVAFAGTSYLVCPLTLDYSAAKLFLDVIDTGVIGVQGTAIADALNTAFAAFKDDGKEKKSKVVIVISDGEDHEGNVKEAIEDAKKKGIIIYSVGVGSFSGAPIPLYDEHGNRIGFKKDKSGKIVTTVLSEATLRMIASETGGKYYHLGSETNVLARVYKDIFKLERKELWTHEYAGFKQKYQIFLLIGLIFVVMEMFVVEKQRKRGE